MKSRAEERKDRSATKLNLPVGLSSASNTSRCQSTVEVSDEVVLHEYAASEGEQRVIKPFTNT